MNGILRTTFEDIESMRFLVQVGAASDYKIFLAGAAAEESVGVLVRAAADPITRKVIAERTLSLARRLFDPRYESRWDAALAVYLWVLSEGADDSLSRLVAEVLVSTPQLWWGRKLALHILAEERYRTAACTIEQAFETPHPYVVTSKDSLDLLSVLTPGSFEGIQNFLTTAVQIRTGTADHSGSALHVRSTVVNTRAEAA